MPQSNTVYTEEALAMARYFYMAHQPKQGDEIVCDLLRRADEWFSWIETSSPSPCRIVIVPILCLTGYLLIIVGILRKR